MAPQQFFNEAPWMNYSPGGLSDCKIHHSTGNVRKKNRQTKGDRTKEEFKDEEH